MISCMGDLVCKACTVGKGWVELKDPLLGDPDSISVLKVWASLVFCVGFIGIDLYCRRTASAVAGNGNVLAFHADAAGIALMQLAELLSLQL